MPQKGRRENRGRTIPQEKPPRGFDEDPSEVLGFPELDSFLRHTYNYGPATIFGRRTLVKDEGGSTMRTLYDAQSFEQIRSGPSFNDESFTSNYSRGVLTQGNGNGELYRFIDDGNTDGRYRYTGDGDIAVVAKSYTGVQVPLGAGGAEVAMNRAGSTQAGATTRGGVSYLGNDALGSMRSATNES